MANSGIGNRFTSVNLNKSYGHGAHANQSNSGGYGLGRGRGGGGGGGMVVLSRPRSSHKAAPKLSIPPPLNLPSLRKEHEKFDTLGTGSGAGGGGGSGARPSSSGMGWSKPSAIVVAERDEVVVGGGDRPLTSESVQANEVVSRGGNTSAYMPPSARRGVGGTDVSVAPPVEKISVLRGEDFPSLRATLNAANGQSQKQKDSAQQKHRHGISEEPSGGSREGFQGSSQVDMRPQVQSSRHIVDNVAGGDSQNGGNSRPQEQGRKQDDYFPGPLPLVRLSPRSDWADDERDTSHGLSNRIRDHGYSKTDAHWDRDFDFPRNTFLPHKPAQYQFDRRGQRDDDVGKGLSNEVSNADPFVRDGRAPSLEGRQGHTWRTSMARDGFGSQDVGNYKNNVGARPIQVNREMNRENKYIPGQFGGTTRDEHISGGFAARDLGTERTDQGYIHNGRQQWNNSVDPNNGRGADRNYQQRFASDRYRVEPSQNNMRTRPSFSSGSKGLPATDHLPNFSRDKRSFSNSERPYVEDPFLSSTSFDVQDPFSGGILGVVKRKKDSNKMLDFPDPARESFEAELERVQQIQEQERRRAVEEQERAMEMARREEEERLRLIREQEERQRRMEEEAREAAWRAEQEKLEVVRKAEELKIAREEEKQRMMMEEERRKQAAKQKLLELEEKIAKRQTVSSKADSGDITANTVKERDLSRPDDFASWEDGERMVERITNSASSDSSLSRPFDMGPRAVSDRDGSFAFTDRGKSFNSWRRDIFDNGNNSSFFSMDHENAHMSPRREASIGGRSFHRKDMYGGQGYMPTSGPYRGGVLEPHMEDFPHARGYRWNISGEGDPYGRNMEFEGDFHENVTDKYEMGWGQGQVQGRGYSPFPDRLYQNSELDEFYSYGRSRYPARQPRVLPPPAFSSIPRTSFKTEDDGLGSSSYENGNAHFNHALQQVDSTSGNHHNDQEENSDIIVHEERASNEEQEQNNRTALGCDSQSSLSVSSPPSSPTQLSPDDFDESRDVSGVAEGQDISLSENEADHLTREGNTVTIASSVADDEEWTVENIEVSQYQEEYDEDVGYHVEDEVHGGEGEKPELTREFDDMHLEKKGSSDMTENLVLGFDQGVEVVIPNDDHEKTLRVDDTSHARTQGTVGPMKPNESLGDLSDRQNLQIADGLQHSAIECSGAMADETEPNNASAHSSMPLDPSAGESSSSSVQFQQPLPSSQAVPSVSGVQGPAELPKLQFGLFSGPSLIPSPVPAIQIGSIQMPLQLHPHIGPPLPHMHASEAPLFQFGQLRYPSPMSQGILSLTPQPMSYVQPNVPQNFPSSQASKGPLAVQASLCSVKNGPLFTMNSDPVQPSNQLGVCQEAKLKEVAPSGGNNILSRENKVEASSSTVDVVRPELRRRNDNFMRNSRPLLNNRASESRPQGRSSSFHSTFNARNSRGPTAHQFPGSKGRRATYSSRSSDTRLASPANESAPSDANGFQRRPQRVTQRYEFRVRQTSDVKQFGLETQSNYVTNDCGTQHKNSLVKEIQSDQPKQANNSSLDKPAGKYATKDGQGTALHPEGSLKRNISSEDDVDVPLQSGVVRVYQQPGIEAPSDEDDFIEVRSKRQMLNDRREQREKEIKAKSSNTKKPQRKSRPAPQGTNATRNTNRAFALSNVQSDTRTAVTSKRSVPNNEVSAALNNIASQPSALAGSQSNAKALTVKPVQTDSYTTADQTFRADGSDLTSDGTRKVDGVQSTLGSRGGSCTKQSVMTLTQTQLEEAMKPASFVTKVVSVGDQSCSVDEQNMPSSSKDSSFSSAANPISSLLAGEKIQFGDVIPPTILSPSKHVASLGTRLSSLSSLDIRTSQSIPSSKNNCDVLFEKEKPLNESYRPLEDREAEAKGAASAVIAAIRNDEVAGNGIRSSDIDGISAGMSGDQHTKSQSKVEETLSVSLPADLSVETPPISIWPPLPTPHSSSQMSSPFPGGPTSHFPFYDMNPMMGGPVFAFGPTDESVGSASQPQKNSAPSSGPLGTWQQCHTGIDSLYGPAGFTAPFISPPGSIPGVQGAPPHMVVYNHFASVGQFGQVGLSYMGTTYVPSGKQPDWKHNPTSTAMGGGEGVSVLRNASNVPTQAPHLAPGSPLLSMASPLGMYEVSPFQSSNETSIHPHWSHVQASSVPSQSSHGSSDHHSSPSNGFSQPQNSSLADGRPFPVGPHAGTTQFADGLGLVDPPVSSGSEASALNLDGKGRVEDSSRTNSASKRNSNKAQPAHQKNAPGQQHYSHYQRGPAQRNGSGADWSNHKMGFRGRNQSSGGDRSFPATKVKQIYVPKQSASGTSSAV